MKEELRQKYEALKTYLKSLNSVAVAYSSGVDSTLLLWAAKEALGDRMCAVTARSCFFPSAEQAEALQFCKENGIRHLQAEVDEQQIEGFTANPPNRCYLCKKTLFTGMKELASREGFAAIAEGSNMDDLGDYRPGMQAIRELEITSPLREVGLYKNEIREISRELGLPTWNKPSYACLASRFPYGEEITREKLLMVDRAEEYLRSLGFHQLRVRIHGKLARIELTPDDMRALMEEDTRKKVYQTLQEYGFSYVSLDLLGYRTGSLNEVLKK